MSKALHAAATRDAGARATALGAGTPPLLALRDASVSFGAVHAVRGATLAVGAGEFIAVVGPNGSGKTTLLRLLHGLVAHSGVREVPRPATQAMVFQRPFLLRLSVRNNVRLALWLARRATSPRERAERVAEALARVGLAALAERPARSLSGGEQQRLALARAWAVQPEIVLLDEPTASLDPSARAEVEALLAQLAADGITVVMSTHDLGLAQRLASRVVYIDDGRIDADVPSATFFAAGAAGRAGLFLKGELSWSQIR